MNGEDVVKQIEPWLAGHRRPAWKPIVEPGDGPPAASKFSGMPWIGVGAPWPECTVCKQRLQLFLQLDLAALPSGVETAHGSGLLQLFHCPRETCAGSGGWQTFADDLSRVRVVQAEGPSLVSIAPQRYRQLPRQTYRWLESVCGSALDHRAQRAGTHLHS